MFIVASSTIWLSSFSSQSGITVTVSTSPDYLTIVLNALLDFFTIITVIIAFLSFRKTSQQSNAALQIAKTSMQASLDTIEEMKEARDQESAPCVIAFFDLVGDSHIFFVVKNIGKSVATDVKLKIEPPFASISTYSKLNELPLIKNGIAALAPESEIRSLFIFPSLHLGEALNACPMYKAIIEYKGGLSLKLRENVMFLDLSVYENILPNHKKDLDHLVKETEQIAKEAKEIKNTFKALNLTLEEIVQMVKNGSWIQNKTPRSLNKTAKRSIKK